MSNCQVEDAVTKERNIKTVNLHDAVSFLKQNPVNGSSLTGKKTILLPDLANITQEKIMNSDQLLTVIPLSSGTKQQFSRILLLEVEDELKSVVFTMYPDENYLSKNFTGKIITTNFNGDFINGFRVKEGWFVSQYVKKKISEQNSSLLSREIIIDGVIFEELNEVIIINSYQAAPTSIDYMSLFNDSSSTGNATDYGMGWDYGGGGSGGETATETAENPCAAAKATTIDAQSIAYSSAIIDINNADPLLEHSITLGKDDNGQITRSPLRSGGRYNVPPDTSWPRAFASIHNHPDPTPLSSGDIYASVQLNLKYNDFTTSYIITNGEVYAIIVTDLVAAKNFVAQFPADQLPGYSPEFPDFIFNQLQVLVTPMGSSIEGRTTAIAFVLDKHNAGITLLKQDSTGNFNPIKTEETIQNGTTTYTPKPCN